MNHDGVLACGQRHLAGPTNERRRDAGEFAANNLRAYAEGRPLQAVITPQIYDAST